MNCKSMFSTRRFDMAIRDLLLVVKLEMKVHEMKNFHFKRIPSLKLTYPLKIGLPKRKLAFQPSIFRGYVSFREDIFQILVVKLTKSYSPTHTHTVPESGVSDYALGKPEPLSSNESSVMW